MITEDYVSFEVAKLLKEKGFDCLCHSYFRKDNPNNLVKEACGANWNDTPFFISRPTLQMTMKWLREVHNINLNIIYIKLFDKGYWNKGHWTFDNIEYKSYEEACEAAIKYSLENLI